MTPAESDSLRAIARVAISDALEGRDYPTLARLIFAYELEAIAERITPAYLCEYLLSDPQHDEIDATAAFTSAIGECLYVHLENSQENISEICEFVLAYLRQPLLTHRMYAELNILMTMLHDSATGRIGEPVPRSVLFNYAVSCQYVSHKAEAIRKFRECLAQDPFDGAARHCLLALLSRRDREMQVISDHLATLPSGTQKHSKHTISLENAVYLMAVRKASGGFDLDGNHVNYAESTRPLCLGEGELRPVTELINLGLLRPAAATPRGAYVFNSGGDQIEGYHFHQILWTIPPSTASLLQEIEQAIASRDWPLTWIEEAPAVCHQLARQECIAYLHYSSSARGINAPDGQKTIAMIDSCLASLSVAQTFGVLWKASTLAANFKSREGINSAHAGNTVVANAAHQVERAFAAGWTLKCYARPKELPRTHVSAVLHDTFLPFGERAFTEPLATLLHGDWFNTATPQGTNLAAKMRLQPVTD